MTRLGEKYHEGKVEVGGDIVTFKVETDKNREAIADDVTDEIKRIIKQ